MPPSSGPITEASPKTAPDQALVPAPFPRADNVSDDRLRADDQPAGAHPLHRAERDQLVH